MKCGNNIFEQLGFGFHVVVNLLVAEKGAQRVA